MFIPLIISAAVLGVSVQDFLEGAEIGDANGYVALETGGRYHAEKVDKTAGKTVVKGSWALKGDTFWVKASTCSGPACKDAKKDFQAQVSVVAERAMLVKSTPADSLMPTGSYYCHYQGCEKRYGIELLSKNAKALTMNYLLDFLIDKNRKRDVTVVWWGKKMQVDAGKTRIETCQREPERSAKAAQLVAADLAELAWVGDIETVASAEKDCQFDVRVYVADSTALPVKNR